MTSDANSERSTLYKQCESMAVENQFEMLTHGIGRQTSEIKTSMRHLQVTHEETTDLLGEEIQDMEDTARDLENENGTSLSTLKSEGKRVRATSTVSVRRQEEQSRLEKRKLGLRKCILSLEQEQVVATRDNRVVKQKNRHLEKALEQATEKRKKLKNEHKRFMAEDADEYAELKSQLDKAILGRERLATVKRGVSDAAGASTSRQESIKAGTGIPQLIRCVSVSVSPASKQYKKWISISSKMRSNTTNKPVGQTQSDSNLANPNHCHHSSKPTSPEKLSGRIQSCRSPQSKLETAIGVVARHEGGPIDAFMQATQSSRKVRHKPSSLLRHREQMSKAPAAGSIDLSKATLASAPGVGCGGVFFKTSNPKLSTRALTGSRASVARTPLHVSRRAARLSFTHTCCKIKTNALLPLGVVAGG